MEEIGPKVVQVEKGSSQNEEPQISGTRRNSTMDGDYNSVVWIKEEPGCEEDSLDDRDTEIMGLNSSEIKSRKKKRSREETKPHSSSYVKEESGDTGVREVSPTTSDDELSLLTKEEPSFKEETTDDWDMELEKALNSAATNRELKSTGEGQEPYSYSDKDLSTSCAAIDDVDQPPIKQKRSLHSSTDILSSSERPHVLPPICVICQGKQWVKTSRGIRQEEHLTTCELVDGGQLMVAAEKKQDDKLLSVIKGKDCVSIKVRYHASCHREYTRFLSKPPHPTSNAVVLYSKSFSHFAKYAIEERIIKGKEIMRMTKLKKLFVKAVYDVEKKDASNYKIWSLKQRILKEYPQLCFMKPKRQYESGFVFVDTLTTEDLLEDSLQLGEDASTTDMDTDTDMGTDSDIGNIEELVPASSKKAKKVPKVSTVRDRFISALDLRASIGAIPQVLLHWPPTASDLTSDKAQSIIPTDLFNFIAWTVGLSDDPEESIYVKVNDKERLRVLNIAQDMVHLATKEKKIMQM